MSRDLDLVECWSSSGRGLVLTGSATEIEEVAETLKLPPDAPITLNRHSTALALWGRELDAYVQRYHCEDLVIQAQGFALQSPSRRMRAGTTTV